MQLKYVHLTKSAITFSLLILSLLFLNSCGWYRFSDELKQQLNLESSNSGSNGGSANLIASLSLNGARFGGGEVSIFTIAPNGDFITTYNLGQIARYDSTGKIIWEVINPTTDVNTSDSQMYNINALAVDTQNNVYVATSSTNGGIIKAFDSYGKFKWKTGFTAGSNNLFTGLVIHPDGYLIATKMVNSNTGEIHRFQLSDGISFGNPYQINNTYFGSIALTKNNNILVTTLTGGAGHTVMKLGLTNQNDSTSDYQSIWQVGTPGTSGNSNSLFNSPANAVSDSNGFVYVNDHNNHRIQRFDENGNYLQSFNTSYTMGGVTLGSSASAILIYQDQIYVNVGSALVKRDLNYAFLESLSINVFSVNFRGKRDSAGNEYFINVTYNNDYTEANSLIRKYNTNGQLLMTFGSNGNGVGQYMWPDSLFVTSNGKVICRDSTNNKLLIFNADGTLDVEYAFSFNFQDIDEANQYMLRVQSGTKIQRYRLSDGQFVDEVTPGGGIPRLIYDQVNSIIYYFATDSGVYKIYQLPIINGAFGTAIIIYNTGLSSVSIQGVAIANDKLYYSIVRPLDWTNSSGFFVYDLNSNLLSKEIGFTGSQTNESKLCAGLIVRDNGDVLCSDYINLRNTVFSTTQMVSHVIRSAIPLTMNDGRLLMVSQEDAKFYSFDQDLNFVNVFGSIGNNNGQFDIPMRIEKDQQDNLYVFESNNSRIQKLDSQGNYLSQWSVPTGYAMTIRNQEVCTSDGLNSLFICRDFNGQIVSSQASIPMIDMKALPNGELIGFHFDSNAPTQLSLVILNSDGSFKKTLTKNNSPVFLNNHNQNIKYSTLVVDSVRGFVYVSIYDQNVVMKFNLNGDYISEKIVPTPSRMTIYNDELFITRPHNRPYTIELF